MNFNYNEEQIMLQDSIEKYLAKNYLFENRLNNKTTDTQLWQTAAELGWLSIPFTEQHGGYGGTAVDLMLLFESLGKHLVTEPFIETLILGGGVLHRLSENGQYNDIISQLIQGEVQCALAHEEPDCAYSLNSVTTLAQRTTNGFQLSGKKSVIYNAQHADYFITSAMLDNNFSLFLIPANTTTLNIKSYQTVDGRNAGELHFDNVVLNQACLMAEGVTAIEVLSQTLDEALLVASAEQVGMMQTLLEATLDYTKQRKQYGTTISRFQVLQHCMSDMYMAIELAKSLMYATAIKLRDKSPDASQFAAALKVKTDKSAREVANNAFQLHGGIATTKECKIGHYLKRITLVQQSFGGSPYQLHHFIKQNSSYQTSNQLG